MKTLAFEVFSKGVILLFLMTSVDAFAKVPSRVVQPVAQKEVAVQLPDAQVETLVPREQSFVRGFSLELTYGTPRSLDFRARPHVQVSSFQSQNFPSASLWILSREFVFASYGELALQGGVGFRSLRRTGRVPLSSGTVEDEQKLVLLNGGFGLETTPKWLEWSWWQNVRTRIVLGLRVEPTWGFLERSVLADERTSFGLFEEGSLGIRFEPRLLPTVTAGVSQVVGELDEGAYSATQGFVALGLVF